MVNHRFFKNASYSQYSQWAFTATSNGNWVSQTQSFFLALKVHSTNRQLKKTPKNQTQKVLSGTEKGKGEEQVCSLSYWMELIKFLLHCWFPLLIILAEIKKVTGYSTEPIIIISFITKYECRYTSNKKTTKKPQNNNNKKKPGQKQLDKYKFTLYSISGLIYKGKQG